MNRGRAFEKAQRPRQTEIRKMHTEADRRRQTCIEDHGDRYRKQTNREKKIETHIHKQEHKEKRKENRGTGKQIWTERWRDRETWTERQAALDKSKADRAGREQSR